MTDFEKAASELLRALRGTRSQIAFARKLGFSGNPITDWENGRRFPTASQALRVAELVHLEIEPAFQRFARVPPPSRERGYPVSEWLSALRGSTAITDLSQRSGCSRHAIARWMGGKAQPRLPDFLRLVEAITGRVVDWVHELVGIGQVPSLRQAFERVEAARQLAFRKPWSEAALRLIETEDFQMSPQPAEQFIAARLGFDEGMAVDLLEELVRARIIERRGSRFAVIDSLTVDTGTSLEQLRSLRSHWARVGVERLGSATSSDWFAYNVITVSKEDAQRIEQRLRAAYREVRTIVNESQPGQVAALLTMHLIRW